MPTSSNRAGRRSQPHGPRKPLPIADRIEALRRLEYRLEAYDYERSQTNLKLEAYAWRVPITVPAYGRTFVLRIEIDPRFTRVFVVGWTGRMKHKYSDGSICMWWPKDPPSRRWQREDGLLKLVDTALVHVFKELYWQETGDWLGEEAPHSAPKINPQATLSEAA